MHHHVNSLINLLCVGINYNTHFKLFKRMIPVSLAFLTPSVVGLENNSFPPVGDKGTVELSDTGVEKYNIKPN